MDWKERIDALMDYHGEAPLISMYVPSPAGSDANEQNRIRLKNALAKARKKSRSSGLSERESKRLLRPVADLVDELPQMQRNGKTLGIFVARGYWQYLDLPQALPELTVSGERFYVKPLFAAYGDDRFDILTLSQNRVRILSADFQGARELPLGDVPASLTDVVGGELTEPHVQYHTGAGPRRSRKSPIYHGQGGGEDDRKEEIALFVRRVIQELDSVLQTSERPLVLAGVDFLLSMFRELSDRPNVLASQIPGNVDALSDCELHAKAWPLVREYFSERRDEAVRTCHAAVERGEGSASIESILPAAFRGRVDSLFVALDGRVWGRFDAERERVERHEEKCSESEDLLELAVRDVHSHAGTVYALPADGISSGTPCMASFRY